jgi:hypothetical protein
VRISAAHGHCWRKWVLNRGRQEQPEVCHESEGVSERRRLCPGTRSRAVRSQASFSDISDAVGPDVIIASSSSGIPVSYFQTEATNPARIVLGHPVNPPHVVPLVEVVGGKLTSAENVTRAVKFYAQIGSRSCWKPALTDGDAPPFGFFTWPITEPYGNVRSYNSSQR